MFDFYRIKEVEGKFIPQKLAEFAWQGISRRADYTWYYLKNQIEFCAVDSLQEAKDIIAKYKEKRKKPKVKYHYNI
jgi:hypothetical protein